MQEKGHKKERMDPSKPIENLISYPTNRRMTRPLTKRKTPNPNTRTRENNPTYQRVKKKETCDVWPDLILSEQRDSWSASIDESTANTSERPRKRSGKPYNPTTHENNIRGRTAHDHKTKTKDEQIDNSLEELHHEATDGLVIFGLGPGTRGLIARDSEVNPTENPVAVPSHVQGVAHHELGVWAIGELEDDVVHVCDSDDDDLEDHRQSHGVHPFLRGFVFILRAQLAEIVTDICDVGLKVVLAARYLMPIQLGDFDYPCGSAEPGLFSESLQPLSPG